MKFLVEGVSFGYRSRQVLDGVDIDIDKGSVCALLGMNGAGKSTLLKCMNRILHPVAGTVYLGETNVLGLKGTDIAKRIGYVPQNGSGSALNVFEMVLLGRKPYIRFKASGEDCKLVEDIIIKLGLEKLADKKIGELSGGELQKTIIARALVQQPELLLLDEPTASLDLRNQIEVMSIIKNLSENDNVTVIVSMHDLNLALRFADKFVFLSGGTIAAAVNKSGITPEIIKDVYDIDVEVRYEKNIPYIVPVF